MDYTPLAKWDAHPSEEFMIEPSKIVDLSYKKRGLMTYNWWMGISWWYILQNGVISPSTIAIWASNEAFCGDIMGIQWDTQWWSGDIMHGIGILHIPFTLTMGYYIQCNLRRVKWLIPMALVLGNSQAKALAEAHVQLKRMQVVATCESWWRPPW